MTAGALLSEVRRRRRAVPALHQRPGCWLLAAVVLNFAAYAQATYPDGTAPVLWMMLDAWLFWRVWRGGRTARFWLLVLGASGVVLHVLFGVGSLISDGISTGQSWTGLALAIASLACLAVPALRPERRPFG